MFKNEMYQVSTLSCLPQRVFLTLNWAQQVSLEVAV